MKLFYRGISYPLQSSNIETLETETTAKFRGVAYHVRRPVRTPEIAPQQLV